MKKIILFCNKRSGSFLWFIAMIVSITLPVIALRYTSHQFEGSLFELMRRIIVGCNNSLLPSVWVDTHLRCDIDFSNIITKSYMIPIDIILLYLMTFSKTFFHLWTFHIFIEESSLQYHDRNKPPYIGFGSKLSFFGFMPVGKKGHWVESPDYCIKSILFKNTQG